MASLMLTILPVIIFYGLLQKHIIKGVMEGAIKA
jgi:raffinose/stachyose/melibiose transport system permease protein